MLGFVDDDDDERGQGRADAEGDSQGDGERDKEEQPIIGYRRRNPFISNQCTVSKKRRD